MPALLSLLLPALVPVASDAIRGIVGKWTGGAGAQPQNVAEAIQLMQAETERLKAVAELDKPSENISKWVADLRGSFRYIAASLIILAAIASLYTPMPPEYVGLVWDAAGSVWAFIFGERLLLKLKGK